MALTRTYVGGREQCFQQIDKLINSHSLRGSESLCKLLRYLAEHALDHPGIALKEYQIATEVLAERHDLGLETLAQLLHELDVGRRRGSPHRAPHQRVVDRLAHTLGGQRLPGGPHRLQQRRSPGGQNRLARRISCRLQLAGPDSYIRSSRSRTSSRPWARQRPIPAAGQGMAAIGRELAV